MSSEIRGPRRAFALGVTMDPCDEGLRVITIDQNGALGRTGRVNEKDIIVAINDVPVRGKDGSALADLIHDGKRWYSGLPGISTLAVRGAGQTRLQTIVVNHLESDVKEAQHIPSHQRKQSNGIDLIEPRPSPSDSVASDSAGIGVTLRSEYSGTVRVADIAPWGSARWAARLAKNDIIKFIDGAPTEGLSARQAVDLINGAHDAGSTVELVFTRERGGGQSELSSIELARARPPRTGNADGASMLNASALPATGLRSSEIATSFNGRAPSVKRASVTLDGKESQDGGNLLSALYAVRDMACHGKAIGQEGGSYAISQRLLISHRHAIMLHQVGGLWASLLPSDSPDNRARNGGNLNGGSSASTRASDSGGGNVAYDLVTSYGHARAALDEQARAVKAAEDAQEARQQDYQAAMATLKQEQEDQHKTEIASLMASLESAREEKARAAARLAELEEEVAALEAAQGVEDMAAEQRRLASVLQIVRPQADQIKEETQDISAERDRSVRNHELVLKARERENANLLASLQDAEKEAEGWSDDKQRREAEESELEGALSLLEQHVVLLSSKAKPQEARRRELLGLLQRLQDEDWAKEVIGPNALSPADPAAASSLPLSGLRPTTPASGGPSSSGLGVHL